MSQTSNRGDESTKLTPVKSKISVSQLKNLHYIHKRASEAANRSMVIKTTGVSDPKEKFLTDRDKPGVPVL